MLKGKSSKPKQSWTLINLLSYIIHIKWVWDRISQHSLIWFPEHRATAISSLPIIILESSIGQGKTMCNKIALVDSAIDKKSKDGWNPLIINQISGINSKLMLPSNLYLLIQRYLSPLSSYHVYNQSVTIDLRPCRWSHKPWKRHLWTDRKSLLTRKTLLTRKSSLTR